MTSLYLYNTLHKRKERLPFADKISLYVCGVTAYDHLHLGHARVFLVFDAFVRFLRSLSLNVFYVRNFTDVDDKIIQRALKEGVSPRALSIRYMQSACDDEAALGILPPDVMPLATDHIPQIIALIEDLIQKGFAYVTASGSVYFRVKKFGAYGALSGKRTDELLEGVRIDNDSEKESPLDFALWKAATPLQDSPLEGELFDSPFSRGRPGWHIECSAMSAEYLGDSFELHGGGPDLVFPHHENEIAQSCAAGGDFAHCFMHVGALLVDGEKMSKSLGNFVTLKSALSHHHKDAIRLFLLSSHYKSPLNYTNESIKGAENSLQGLYESFLMAYIKGYVTDSPLPRFLELEAADARLFALYHSFHSALLDDFHTPKAFDILFQTASLCQRLCQGDDETAAKAALAALLDMGGVLGFFAPFFAQRTADSLLPLLESILALEGFGNPLLETPPSLLSKDKARGERIWESLKVRAHAKERKDFASSDLVRDNLLQSGIAIRDLQDGRVLWSRVEKPVEKPVEKHVDN